MYKTFPPFSVGRRLGSIVLGLSAIGLGFSFAQERQPARTQSVESPGREQRSASPERQTHSMDRPGQSGLDRQGHQGDNRNSSTQPGDRREGSIRPGDRRFEIPSRPATNDIIPPRPRERCTVLPDPMFWKHRNVAAEIQAMARRGFIAVHPVAESVNEFTGIADFPAGWTAYGFRVPPGESLHIRLTHLNEGWFSLIMVNKWGGKEQGMLRNLIPTGNPEVVYKNPNKETRSVYVIVDDPGWMSSSYNPFTLKMTRSWDPTKKKVDTAPIVTGIWAEKKEEAKPADAVPSTKEVAAPVQTKS